MQDPKIQDLKLADQTARHENAAMKVQDTQKQDNPKCKIYTACCRPGSNEETGVEKWKFYFF